MRTSAFLGAFLLATSAMAIPLDFVKVENALDTVGSVEHGALSLVGVGKTPKRSITDSVDEIVEIVTDLVPAIHSTVARLEAEIEKILHHVEKDVDGILAFVAVEVQSIIDEVQAVIDHLDIDVTVSIHVEDLADTSVSIDLASTIDEVQALLDDVQALVGVVSVSSLQAEVTSLVQALLTTLHSLSEHLSASK